MKIVVELFAAVFLIGLVHGQDWISGDHGDIAEGAFVGGHQSSGPLYICKSYFRGEQCVGKIAYGYDSCKVPWGDKENDDYYYSVLIAPSWAFYTLSWESGYSKGSVPSGAVRIDSGIYVGRYKRGSDYIPGKVVTEHKALFYGYNGKEYDVRKGYEVLVKKTRSVKCYELYNVKYDLSRAVETVKADNKEVGAKQLVTNDSPFRVETEVTLHVDKTVSRSWSEVEEFETVRGRKTTVTAGIPAVAEGTKEWGVTKTHTYTYSYGENHTHTVTSTQTIKVKLPPRSEVYVYMVAQETEVDVPFEGNLKITFDDGSMHDSIIHGVYADIHMASFQSRIEQKEASEELFN